MQIQEEQHSYTEAAHAAYAEKDAMNDLHHRLRMQASEQAAFQRQLEEDKENLLHLSPMQSISTQ